MVMVGYFINSYVLKPKISKDSLVIGTLWKPEQLDNLKKYLESNLVPDNLVKFITGKKIQVIVDGAANLSYQEAQNKMKTKQWDIAFTLSPINSIFAKDHNYIFVANMFPKLTQYYQSGLFVRKDSPIKSIDDLNSQTKIALGAFNSASSFYMPVYDLYGKTVNIMAGNRGHKIMKMVKSGLVDVGAAAIGDVVRKNDSNLRIIDMSRNIPGSGVYLSPSLSPWDQETIKQILLNAPSELQEKSNYGAEKEADYTKFREIIKRVDKILICSDFSKNPVNLFCPPGFQPTVITGRINGVIIKANSYIITVVSDHKKYRIYLKPEVIEAIFGSRNLTEFQNKSVVVKLPKPPLDNGSGESIAEVTQYSQINLVP